MAGDEWALVLVESAHIPPWLSQKKQGVTVQIDPCISLQSMARSLPISLILVEFRIRVLGTHTQW